MSKWLAAVVTVVAGLCGAAFVASAADTPQADEASQTAARQAAAAVARLSQLCQIDIKGDKKDQWMRLPKAESSLTQHRLSIAGRSIDYTATAGTLIVRDEEDKPMASIGYVAYTRPDVKGGARPITFAFNGGPGSSSMWLHMGVLGPRRVVVADPDPTPPAP
jgi:carboxypeptidase C (cathepsin A)